MIESLLLRIAKRGPHPISKAGEHAALGLRGSARNSSHTFAASAPVASPALGAAAPASLAAWAHAKAEYHRSRAKPNAKPELPIAFSSFTHLHAQVASLIWEERKAIRSGIAHIVAPSGEVLAAVFAGEQRIAVRKESNWSDQDGLMLKPLPASAAPFEPKLASQFESTTTHTLMWYFGQAVSQAVEHIPEALLHDEMVLRKLPLVNPNALDLRHLHLIHIFSAGPIRFQALVQKLEAAEQPSICADLASMYLTGCLVGSRSTGDDA